MIMTEMSFIEINQWNMALKFYGWNSFKWKEMNEKDREHVRGTEIEGQRECESVCVYVCMRKIAYVGS